MNDKEKRAHDLAVAIIPHVMDECGWEYYLFDNGSDIARINPDIVETYNEFYTEFLNNII